ncbi:SusD/RagB family nutrient-binding outer membrane lipoprotein [Pontibacter silvestris]|uniref:SusD/RagB family nutrient-binding outer membrane lipoprotein n=1 Tax=Pontibacter silvestris TaxID=2305183 RepID=A0ABW4X0F7_9BACT|nr:SusD/RagB family nutrient-binding outer membrane lipoprotein [Pontibacter silvestris]MCC9138684.1 SusD/RagB family nutrient-binding outer membrane lipoprotein [Pontibacter silvestris]
MKRIYKPVVAVLVSLHLLSCEKIVDDLNVDPNNPTDAPANFVFTGTQIANVAVQEGQASRLSLIWTGYGTGIFQQYGTWYTYSITASNFDDDWNNVFTGTNKNAIIAIEKAEALGNRKMAGITKIVQVNSLGTATELWGDIPYEEAGLVDNPIFENQQELYPKLIARLDEAIADLESGVGTVGAEDIHFSGDAIKWIEVANTLKARYYMDIKQYDAAYAAAEKGISAYANSLYAPHGTTPNVNQNHTYSLLTDVRAGSITAEGAYNAELLNPSSAMYRGNPKTDETARFKYYYLENGVNAPGVIEPNTLTTASARGFFAMDADFPMVTYQENILTLAEAALRSGKGFDIALGHLNTYRNFLDMGGYIDPTYQNSATLNYEPYVAEDFAVGGIENTDGISPEDALLREILQERYVTFYGQHIGWNDERRTRSEAYGVKLQPNNGDRLPSRFIYSQNELNSNNNSPNPTPSLFDPIYIYQ